MRSMAFGIKSSSHRGGSLNKITETNMSIFEINEAAVKAAKEFFSTKTPRNFYKISALQEDILNEVWYHQEFSPEEVAQLVELRKKYGEDDFFNHLGEVFEDEDIIHDFTGGAEILGINLDEPMRKYSFTVHVFDGEKMYHRSAMVELSDDEYVELLALRLDDNHINMSVLRHTGKDLHDKILKEVEWQVASDDGLFMCPDPFLVTMDEVNEDAEAIMAANPEFDKAGYRVYWL